MARQRDTIETFSYMGLLGKIDMKNPEINFVCFEECLLSSTMIFGGILK